jgi:hypothetical protein
MVWVTKTLSSRAPPCFGGTLSRWSRLHLQSLAPINPHSARVVGYGPFSLWVIRKVGLCPSIGDIKRLMMMMMNVAGFITRNGPETPENRRFLGIAKVHWLKRLSTKLPKKILDLSWPPCPATCQEASRYVNNNLLSLDIK